MEKRFLYASFLLCVCSIAKILVYWTGYMDALLCIFFVIWNWLCWCFPFVLWLETVSNEKTGWEIEESLFRKEACHITYRKIGDIFLGVAKEISCKPRQKYFVKKKVWFKPIFSKAFAQEKYLEKKRSSKIIVLLMVELRFHYKKSRQNAKKLFLIFVLAPC